MTPELVLAFIALAGFPAFLALPFWLSVIF
jgi:hypothetical protein